MTRYTKEELERLSGTELMQYIDEGDIIEGLFIRGYMPFSSYTGLPYDMIGKNETRLIIGGFLARYQEKSGPFSVIIRRKSSPSLFSGVVEDREE